MREEDITKKLEKGLYREDTTALNSGAFWETFPLDSIVIQAPNTGEEYRVGKNTFMYNILADHVPVPEVVTTQEEPPAFSVYENLQGITLAEAGEILDREEYLEAVESSGEALAEIHQVEGQAYGPPETNNYQRGSHDSWQSFIEEKTQEIERMVEHELFQSVAKRAENHLDISELPDQPSSRIIHNDYRQENIIIDDSLCAQVIDLDNSHYGDRRFDLVRSEGLIAGYDEEVWKAFRRGYRKSGSLEMPEKIRDNYTALAIMHSAASGERNKEVANTKEWSEGLHNWIEARLE